MSLRFSLRLLFLCVFIFNIGCGGGSIVIFSKKKQKPIVKVEKGDLIRAIIDDDLERVKLLLNAGADINENIGSETDEITPLIAAVILRREQIASHLIEKGAQLHPMYKGYQANDFAFSIYGEESPLTRSLNNPRLFK